MAAAYYVRGGGDRWAVIRMSLDGRRREDIVADGISRDTAEELCFQKLEEQLAGVAEDAAAELPLGDIARRRPSVRRSPPGAEYERDRARITPSTG